MSQFRISIRPAIDPEFGSIEVESDTLDGAVSEAIKHFDSVHNALNLMSVIGTACGTLAEECENHATARYIDMDPNESFLVEIQYED